MVRKQGPDHRECRADPAAGRSRLGAGIHQVGEQHLQRTIGGLFGEEMPDNAKVLLSQPSDSLLFGKSQCQRELGGDRFGVIAGNGGLLSEASREDNSF